MLPLKDNLRLERFPLITALLVAANVLAYLFSIRHQLTPSGLWSGPTASLALHDGAIPYAFTHPGEHCALLTHLDRASVGCGPGVRGAGPSTWQTAFTSMFLHAGLLHLAGNMLFLGIFGPSVEDSMTRPRFLAFYLLGGLVALAAQVAVGPNTVAPTLGASGAVAAVLGGYLVRFRHARVLTIVFVVFFFTIIELPAVALLGVWFAAQVYFGAAALTNPVGSSGGVAYVAHVGGFLFGLVLIGTFATARKSSPRRLAY